MLNSTLMAAGKREKGIISTPPDEWPEAKQKPAVFQAKNPPMPKAEPFNYSFDKMPI